MIKADSYPSQF